MYLCIYIYIYIYIHIHRYIYIYLLSGLLETDSRAAPEIELTLHLAFDNASFQVALFSQLFNRSRRQGSCVMNTLKNVKRMIPALRAVSRKGRGRGGEGEWESVRPRE